LRWAQLLYRDDALGRLLEHSMIKPLVAFTALMSCLAAPALAQTEAPPPATAAAQPTAAPLPPVDTMTCEQMQGEMIVAGQQMQAQMDPSFGADAQAMQDTIRQRQHQATAGAAGAAAMCMIPGLGMACAAAQQAQMAQQMSHAGADRAQMDHLMGSVTNSMAGIDIDRMQALNVRFESQHCPMPQAPQ
jgi:hypothetical protein